MVALMIAELGTSEAATREGLVCPVRKDWDQFSNECPCISGWKPSDSELNRILDDHGDWLLEGLLLEDAGRPGRAVLCDAILDPDSYQTSIRPEGVNLRRAQLSGPDL